MNIGKLYQTNTYTWFIYPTKDIAGAINAHAKDHLEVDPHAVCPSTYYSKRFNCNVSYILPNSIFFLLEKDGNCLKILSANGELGWINWIVYPENKDWAKDFIEEVKE